MSKRTSVTELKWKVERARPVTATAKVWPVSTVEVIPQFIFVAETQFIARYICKLHNEGVAS